MQAAAVTDEEIAPATLKVPVRSRLARLEPKLLGLVLGAAAVAAYLIGSGRVFGYDASVTFANFVATPNLIDAFAVHSQQPTIPLAHIASNDHVLLSLVSHVIYSVTGTRSEVVYRLLPALAGGATVGVSATVLASRFGIVAGACSGLYVATVPMFVEYSRDLRGYSIAALLALLATLLFFRPRTKWRLAAYGTLLGSAIAAHLFVGLVLVGHVVWTIARWSWRDFGKLLPAWAVAGGIALAAYGYALWVTATQHGYPPQLFDPVFPRDLILYLLGAQSVLAIGLWLSTAGLGLFVLRQQRLVWAAIAVVAVTVLVLWLVIRPWDLYPRFFIYLIPGCAYLMAAAIKRWIVLAPVVVLGAAAAIVSSVPEYTTDPLALRQAANAVHEADASGQRLCIIHEDEQMLGAYAPSGFVVVTSADQLPTCDEVMVVSWGVDVPIRDEAGREFPRWTRFPAVYPTVLLMR